MVGELSLLRGGVISGDAVGAFLLGVLYIESAVALYCLGGVLFADPGVIPRTAIDIFERANALIE